MDVRCVRLCVILLTLVWGGCASRSARPQPFPVPETARSRDTAREEPASRPEGAAIVQAALDLQGTPYGPGGSGPDRFDCSGLVQFVFARFDIALPRTVAQQFAVTSPIALSSAAAGDLLFFRISGEKPSHVAIAIGDGQFVHAPSARGTVRVESLSSRYWRERFQSARRVRQGGAN
jgi:cell wall-associated NlpC family hydrolase